MQSLSHSRERPNTTRVWRNPAILLSAVAVLASFVTLWNAGIRILSTPFKKPAVSIDAAVPTPATEAVVPTVAAEPLEVPMEPRGTDASASKVPLPLVLGSTSLGRNPSEGFASLGVDPDWPQTYAAGALLANGARLIEIHPDRVVLEREGNTADLVLSSALPSTDASAIEAAVLHIGGEQEALQPEVGSSEVITEYVRPSPVFDGAQFLGLRVIPGINAHIFAQLGLKSGDVITAMDGVPLTDHRQAVTELRQVSTGRALMVSLQRDGLVQEQMLDGSVIAGDRAKTLN